MVSFENFVKAMPPSLSELKVIPSFCFAFKIPDDVTATNKQYMFSAAYIKVQGLLLSLATPIQSIHLSLFQDIQLKLSLKKSPGSLYAAFDNTIPSLCSCIIVRSASKCTVLYVIKPDNTRQLIITYPSHEGHVRMTDSRRGEGKAHSKIPLVDNG